MKKKGKITTWNDDKGFGFISPETGGERVFVHISSFANRKRRPAVDQQVTYSLSSDKQGRPRANKVAYPGEKSPGMAKEKKGVVYSLLALVFFVVVMLSVFFSKLSPLILILYLVVSLFTYLIYAKDKRAAKKGKWRTPENTLHLLALSGGWPGAMIAQQQLRHKSSKQPFRFIFWITVLLNCGAFAWLFTPSGSIKVQYWLDVKFMYFLNNVVKPLFS